MAELYMVEFKGSRREFCYNAYYHSLKLNDHVIVQVDQGEEIGQLIKKINTDPDFSGSARPHSILRRAGEEDVNRLKMLRKNEIKYKNEVLDLVRKHGLNMKIVDVECRYDGNKITFFFTAEHRVDFRTLVRDLASRYRTRIELRQIGVRDEARRIDGYGVCGRRQCCNSHLRDFAPISTQQARLQDLSLNPSKISGNCGRLLCCLRYEADMYAECKAMFPSVGTLAKTKKGEGMIERIDVFNKQAILSDAENIPFRVKAEEILDQITAKAGRPVRKAETEQVSQEEEEELKRLDEPDDAS